MRKYSIISQVLLMQFLLLCLGYTNALNAQNASPNKQIADSVGASKSYLNTTNSKLKKLAKQDSLLSFKRIKIRTSVTAETRYYGLQYENTNLPQWTTTYQINNKIDLGGLPFQFDAFLGDKIAIPGRGISRIQFKFDANTFVQNLAKQVIEEQQKKLLNDLKNDSNFQKYKTANRDVETHKDQLNQRSYQNQIQSQEKIVKQYESTGDSALMKKPIYKDAKKNVDQYNKRKKDLDSLKQYIEYIDKINPMWKSLQDTTKNFSNKAKQYDQKECMNHLDTNKLIPAPLRMLSHIRRFEAGMVFPDFHPLIFKGAPIKGMLFSIQKKKVFADAAFGKIYSPGDFFRDTFITSKNYALSFRTGIEYKKIRLSYTMLQTRKANTTDTFAFRYYFESPKETRLHGFSAERINKTNKIFVHIAVNDLSTSPLNTNTEQTRSNDINKILTGVSQPISSKSAFQIGYKIGLPKTKSELTLKYNYQGQYYISPMRVFTQPPGKQLEAILQQSFFKKHILLKMGTTMQRSRFSKGYFDYNDKTFSFNFQLNVSIKKLPAISISYMPYYRTSVYQNQEVLLKMEQLNATAYYMLQKKVHFISLVGSYARNKVVNIYSGIYEQAVLYSTYKNIKSPLGYNLILSYFSKPMVSRDSAITYDIKGAIEYQVLPTLMVHVGGGYAINKVRSRYYPYFDMSWNNIYVGQIKLRADYTWLTEFGIYKQGMSVIASITRTIF